MPQFCAVLHCVNAKQQTKPIKLFQLPIDSEERCFRWLYLMGRDMFKPKGLEYIKNNVKICEAHFQDCMFTKNEHTFERQLNENAIPSIFNNCGYKVVIPTVAPSAFSAQFNVNMKCCSVFECPYSQLENVRKNNMMSYFSIPTEPRERCFKWLELTGRTDLKTKSMQQIRNKQVCAEHFDKVYFAGYGRSRLGKDAIPTIFVNCGLNASGKSQGNDTPRKKDYSNCILKRTNNKLQIPVKQCTSQKEILANLDSIYANIEEYKQKDTLGSEEQPSVNITDNEFLAFCQNTFNDPVFDFINTQLTAIRNNPPDYE